MHEFSESSIIDTKAKSPSLQKTSTLLPKTIAALSTQQIPKIQTTLLSSIQDEGLEVKVLDLIFGHYFNYVLLGDGLLLPVFLYEGSITYKHSSAHGLPKLHFCRCHEIEEDFSLENKALTLKNRHYTARLTRKNGFTFSITQGLSQVGLYNDYPLELCPMCSDLLTQMREGEVINSTLGVYVFSLEWLKLLENNAQIRHKELLALQSQALSCHKCKKGIGLDSQIWLQINEPYLKLFCC